MEGRPNSRQEYCCCNELPHSDHSHRSDGWKSVSSDTRADLIADAAARHGQQAVENAGLFLTRLTTILAEAILCISVHSPKV